MEGDRGDCWGAITETIFREFLLLVFGTENDDGDDENAERPTSFWRKKKKTKTKTKWVSEILLRKIGKKRDLGRH